MNDAESDDSAPVRSRLAVTARRNINANDDDNHLSLAELADNARHLPSKSWTVGVALIAVALVASLVAFALTFQRFVGLI